MSLRSFAAKFVLAHKGTGVDCRRIMRRVPQRMKFGYLWNDGLLTPRLCSIKDLSVSGAKVQNVDDEIKPHIIRDGVRLYFADEKHEIICSLAWVKGNTMGLRFESRPLKPSRHYKAI